MPRFKLEFLLYARPFSRMRDFSGERLECPAANPDRPQHQMPRIASLTQNLSISTRHCQIIPEHDSVSESVELFEIPSTW